MKSYRGYIIDLDGTLFRGTEVIPGALDFMKKLNDSAIPYLFLTNNSSRTPERVAEKLQEFGFHATPEHVYTSALATAKYIKEHFGKSKVFVIGEEGLHQAIASIGCIITDDRPDVVVVGIDRFFTYEKMKKAALAVLSGAIFIGTNADIAVPTEEGPVPGSGSLSLGISATTGIKPIFMGKPEKTIITYALERLGISKSDTLIIGDNLKTDILAGVENQIDTLLVLSGITTTDMLEKSAIQPTYVCKQLNDWMFQS